MTRSALFALCGALTLSACASTGPTSSSASAPSTATGITAASLNGSHWRLVKIDDQPVPQTNGDRAPRVTFIDGILAANVGCNGMSGGYTLEGNVIRVGGLRSTMMACEREVMVREMRTAEILSTTLTVSTNANGQMILTGENGGHITLARQ